MRRRAVTAAGIILLLLAAIWPSDYLLWRYRVRSGKNPYGSHVVTTYYVIPQKNNRVEMVSGGKATERCVNALIPHEGYRPCWYVARHTEQRIQQ